MKKYESIHALYAYEKNIPPKAIQTYFEQRINGNSNKFVPVTGDDGLDAEHQGFGLYRLGCYVEAEKALMYAANLKFPAPALYERLAILYKKQKRYQDEINILEYGLAVLKENKIRGTAIPKLKERLIKAKARK